MRAGKTRLLRGARPASAAGGLRWGAGVCVYVCGGGGRGGGCLHMRVRV
jgi:hypothetical protein